MTLTRCLSYFWVPSSPHKHFWEALLCQPTNGPSLKPLSHHQQGDLFSTRQLCYLDHSWLDKGLASDLQASDLLIGQCPRMGAQDQNQTQWVPFHQDVDCLNRISLLRKSARETHREENRHRGKGNGKTPFGKSNKGLLPGGPVVENPSAHAGNAGSIPGPGRFHRPQSNKARGPRLLSQHYRAREPQLLSSGTAMKSGPRSPQLEKARA